MLFIFLNRKYWNSKKLKDEQIEDYTCDNKNILNDTIAGKEIRYYPIQSKKDQEQNKK